VPYNVFLSFSMEDKDLVELFRGQAKNKRLDLEFRDYSIKEPFDYQWKTNCERVMRMCSATMVLIGRDTHKSSAVDWEINKTIELGKGLMAVRLLPTSVTVPASLTKFKVTPVSWNFEAIMSGLHAVAR
jgi:hypothetical protein